LQVHRETQTDNENITFIFAPSFVPCDIFREILKDINKNHFFILKMISEIKTSILWLVIILQCVVKKLLIGKYKCSAKKITEKKTNFFRGVPIFFNLHVG